jgi:3-hydroxyacyl-CoA dehydrogenase
MVNSSGPVYIECATDIAFVSINNPPVNASTAEVRRGIIDALESLSSVIGLKAVVIIGAGTTFVSGSDIREFSGPLPSPQLPLVIAAIENAPWPVVAAISGVALGGGFELALGCDGRIATRTSIVGLPEVKFGIIPGAGGTQRLPRLVGVAKAIELVANGTRVPAPTAYELNMIDALSDGDLRSDAAKFARALTEKRRIADVAVPPSPPGAIEKSVVDARRKSKGLPAVEEAIASVLRAAELPLVEGLAKEREIFQLLRTSVEATALRYQFFAERAAVRLPALRDVTPRNVETVGVIGGGTMGSGIAVSFLDAGYHVALVERDEAALSAAVDRVRALIARSLNNSRISQVVHDRRLERFSPTSVLEDLANSDLVIEAVFEDMAVKQSLFRKLGTLVKRNAILASNTSYLDINEMARATERSHDIVGLHFFSPANIMRLIEVVKADDTAPDVLAAALDVGRRLGKVPVVAGGCDGFIGNRIYSSYRQHCEFIVEDGAWPEEVDAAIEAFGFAMGPFAVGDLSGLDIAWQRRKRLASNRDPRMRYVDIPDTLCEAGRFGCKSGAGYYHYDGLCQRTPDPIVHGIIEAASRAKGIARRPFSVLEIQRRAVAAMINEAGLVLEDGIAQRSSDIDVVLVNGFGFPSYRGGPLFWAAHQPRKRILAAIDEIEATAGGHGFRRCRIDDILDALANV